MKKIYEKPVFVRKGKLSMVVASIPSNLSRCLRGIHWPLRACPTNRAFLTCSCANKPRT